MPDSSLKNIFPNHKLAPFPCGEPQFSIPFKDEEGNSFLLTEPKAIRALIACMDMEAALQGAASHWGGPSAFAEIISSLFALLIHTAKAQSKNGFDLFHVINDAGHCENAFYALKASYGFAGLKLEDLKKFRSIESVLTGHGEAHLFPSAVYLSNGPLASTLAQAQGLAMADKLLERERISIVTLSDGACMEGEAKEALTAIPGLAQKNKINPFLLLISYNNTKLTGRIDEDSFSIQPYLESLSELGWDSSFISRGNDLNSVFPAIQSALKKVSQQKKPVALIFKTCKGFGVKKTSEDSSGGHGFPLKKAEELLPFIKEIYSGSEIPSEILNWIKEIQNKDKKTGPSASSYFPDIPFEKVQLGVSKALMEQKEKGKALVSISSDLYGSTGLAGFRKKFPDHSFDMGVAEANMISVAVGFSKQGFIPVVDTFSQFAVTKGSLPLIMSALSQAPVIGIFSHAGFQDSADGASHQALSYFAKTCSLPQTEVYALSSSKEAYHFLSQTIENFHQERKKGRVPKSSVFFLGRETFPQSFNVSSYSLKKAQVVWDDSKKKKPVLIVSCGPLLMEAYIAGKKRSEKGYGTVVINSPCVSDPDKETLKKYLKICGGRLLVVEDHQASGGLASQLLLALKDNLPSRFKHLAVQGDFGRSAYKAIELYQKFGLDHSAILKNLNDF